ncbi:MAG: hypothetical protein HGB19_02655 [Chlorobiales bacterium]|jgi:hypothetical protein|nr:hypothetical protein [Chlorobiales bacterium]
MKRYTVLIVTGVLITAIVVGFMVWKQGTPYQSRYYSPNHRYYVQKYHTVSLSSFMMAMPGQGSDMIDGYIRLYDQNDRMVYERFETFIRDVKPIWAGREVFLMGVEEMDNSPWILPQSSE